jgi:hypothetical protein
MNQRPVIDAGPSLNSLSINKERLLIATMGKLSAPESVQTEVLRKAAQDSRFRPAESTWRGPSRRPDRGTLAGRAPDHQPAH